ncbi:MAG: hypothetical protein OEZ43_02180 [Gammaproteobacteria bacterium]|nr:hypothetical protein [Gammaproteobacteria bacterium]
MNRGLLLLFLLTVVLIYLGFRARKFNTVLSLALYTASATLMLLFFAGFFGLIGA